jgi:four helix bundle protein
MANIAEGFDGTSDADFMRFLNYSRQSASELQSHFVVTLDQSYISEEEFKHAFSQAERAKSIIGGLIRYLRAGRP